MPFEQQRKPHETDLDEIEAITGLPLTNSFKRVFMMYSGCRIEGFGPRIEVRYPNGAEAIENLQAFLTTAEIREQWQFIGYLQEFADHFELGTSFVESQYLIPIAEVYDGGIYMAVGGRHIDKLFLADNGDFGIACIANSADEFLKLVDLSN